MERKHLNSKNGDARTREENEMFSKCYSKYPLVNSHYACPQTSKNSTREPQCRNHLCNNLEILPFGDITSNSHLACPGTPKNLMREPQYHNHLCKQLEKAPLNAKTINSQIACPKTSKNLMREPQNAPQHFRNDFFF